MKEKKKSCDWRRKADQDSYEATVFLQWRSGKVVHGQVVSALDYEAGDLGSIPDSGETIDWLFSAGW